MESLPEASVKLDESYMRCIANLVNVQELNSYFTWKATQIKDEFQSGKVLKTPRTLKLKKLSIYFSAVKEWSPFVSNKFE